MVVYAVIMQNYHIKPFTTKLGRNENVSNVFLYNKNPLMVMKVVITH